MMDSEVSVLPYVGKKTTEALNKAGIFTVRDLFYHLPRAYENYQSAIKIRDIEPGKVTVKGRVESADSHPAKTRRLTITEATISDGTDSIRAVWFNQPYRLKQLDKKREYLFSGNFELKNGRYQLVSPSVVLANDVDKTAADNGFLPVYPAKGQIKPDAFRRLFDHLRSEFAKIPDLLPSTTHSPIIASKQSRKNALYLSHFPHNKNEAENAHEYLAYEELFELILAAKLNQSETRKLKSPKISYNNPVMHRLLDSLPFELTKGQKLAAWGIIKDLGKTTPMNRLLQGDVGSGKTVVAATAALQAIQSGYQVALLAPTAILATQHAEGLDTLLKPLGIKIGLLIGSTKRKSALKAQIKQGNVDLVVGTHALITDDTKFKNLALCIIDEQHRFGVNQRQKLLLKSPEGFAPHLLSMTATPIPRSLQLTVFGDLDVSVIKELPKGRQPIETKAFSELNLRENLYPKITNELAKGRQVYWICKTIEDSPTKETTSVKKQAEKLRKIFRHTTVEFLHGRMKQSEKDEIMEKFAKHKIDILVSTTVVEVGVDVPNASAIAIMDADRYGLAQLHQLRGRVGRGRHKSYCFLIVSSDSAPTRRLRELEKSTDGFHLAEVDLKLRGPGEIYGSLQHGALDLRIASFSDTHLISLAQAHVRDVVSEIEKNPDYMLKYPELRRNIKKYQQLTTLN